MCKSPCIEIASTGVRTRHFSAPASSGDLCKSPGHAVKSELQWRLSLKKPSCSTTWLRRKGCFLRNRQLKLADSLCLEPVSADATAESTADLCQQSQLIHDPQRSTLPSFCLRSSGAAKVADDRSVDPTADATADPTAENWRENSNFTSGPSSLPAYTRIDCSPTEPRHRWPSETLTGDPGGGQNLTFGVGGHFHNVPKEKKCCYSAEKRSFSAFKKRDYACFSGWIPLIFSFSFLLSVLTLPVDAKRCSSMLIKHDVNKFKNLTDCSIIEGHLIIAAMDDKFAVNFTFPELREVTEYVILYQADNIVNLNQLFPNLAVIRGNKLVMDFALVMYQMDKMTEIGLKSLTHILRGGVRIEKNRLLCYVDSIDWKSIVDTKYHANIHIEENEDLNVCPLICPENCPQLQGSDQNGLRNCWNSNSCQIDPRNLRVNNKIDGPKCDDQCIGGCSGPSHLDCYACKNVMDEMSNGRKNCRINCPDGLLLYGEWRCITEVNCSQKFTRYNIETIDQEKPYKNFQGKCLESCPADTEEKDLGGGKATCKQCLDCSKECLGATIRSLEALRKFEGCTKIMGDLTIQISGKNVVDELEKNLGKVTVITGTLKISRSFPIVSLDFFKALTEIQGTMTPDSVKKTQYSLEILENENLQKLFPAKSQVRITFKNGPDATPVKGRAFIHYNQKLCRTEIKRLLNTSNMHDPGDKSPDISYGTNGHKSVCSEEILNLNVETLGEGGRALKVQFDNYQEKIAKNYPNSDTRALLNYEIHYREIDFPTFKAMNVTKFGGRDACGNDEWSIEDHPPSPSSVDSMNNEIWPAEVSIITDGIKPYSYYAIFVTTLIIRQGIGGGEDIKSAASDIVYFHTPEGDPDQPQNVVVHSLNYSSVNLTWEAPENPNGIIEEYHIEITHHKVNVERLLELRPFCNDNYGVMVTGKEDTVDTVNKKPDNKNPDSRTRPGIDGTCDCSNCGKVKPNGHHPDINQKAKLEESQFHDELLNSIYTIDIPRISTRRKRSIDPFRNDSNIIGPKTKKSEFLEPEPEEVQMNTLVVNASVGGNVNQFVINDLIHYSKYTVRIKACHGGLHQNYLGNFVKRCSLVTSKDFRTDRKPGADDILGDIRSNQDKNNGTDVWITWDDPPDPNLAIVNYRFQFRMQNSPKTSMFETCEDAKKFYENGRKYASPTQGSFFVRVRAVSLAGNGAWSREILITTGEGHDKLLWVLLPILVICFGVVAFLVYLFVKKQRPTGDETTLNPNYCKRNFEGIEIARDLIERGRELGTGSFGTVYDGIYKHPGKGRTPCAIKEAKNAMLREQLLSEADLMRTINTPHVVQLLGVVTEGFPQFVVLELMERGDLKKHLRSLRRLPPNESDILLMAIQVADGMAYLSTVPNPKIIHRDLAARNCMVNDKVIVKIGDFGLARDLCYAQDYYRMNGKDWLPVRWMSPESLRDSVFSSASDVWAYGVVLWEMVTLAEQPYQGLSNEEVLNFVKNRRTMEIPKNCPELISRLMTDCWAYEAEDRPTFVEICQRLLEYANDEFRKNSFITSALCRRVLQRIELASGDQDELPAEEAERAPLQQNGNGNGDVNNGHAIIPPDALREFNGAGNENNGNSGELPPQSQRQYNMWQRFRRMLRPPRGRPEGLNGQHQNSLNSVVVTSNPQASMMNPQASTIQA